jgi:excisionase family DNA binding protein
MEKSHFRPNEVAKLLGVSSRTVRQWLHQKRLPFSKIGHRVCLIAKADLDAFIESNKQEAV